MRNITDFMVFNYFSGETKPNYHYKNIQRCVSNIYCLGLKRMSIGLNSIMKTKGISDLFNFLLTGAKYNEKQLFVYNEVL